MSIPAKPVRRKPVAAKAPAPKVAPKAVKPVVAEPAKPAAETVETAVDTAKEMAAETVDAGVETAEAVAEAASEAVEAAPAAVEMVAEASESIETPETPEPARVADPLPAASVTALKGPIIMTDAMETAKSYAEEAKTRIQGAMSEMNEKTRAAMEKSAKAFEELSDLTKGNLEAIVESSKIAAKGVETLGQDAAEFGRKSFEKTSATMKSFAAVKTPAEFFQLQSDLLSTTLDAFAAEASKNSEMLLKLAGDITQPISSRVSVVTEKMKALAA